MAALLPDGNVILGSGWSGEVYNDLVDVITFLLIDITHFDVYHPTKGWSVISIVDDDTVISLGSMVLMADGTIMVVKIGGDVFGEDFTAAAILDPATPVMDAIASALNNG